MRNIPRIRKRASLWRNDNYTDRCYALQLFMSGEFDVVNRGISEYTSMRRGDADLGDYPAIMPALATEDGMIGLQNHSLVNSRINVQGVVHVKPEFHWLVDDPTIKQMNGAWIRQNAEANSWGDQHYLAGMEVEAQGLGACEWGLAQDGTIANRYRPILDSIIDFQGMTPSEWRGVFNRQRIDLDEALDRYGHLCTEDEIKDLLKGPRLVRGAGGRFVSSSNAGIENNLVPEWTYWDNESCMIFLGGISSKKAILITHDDNGELIRIAPEDEESAPAGDNPWGVIPYSYWVDSYAPGVPYPVGKTETTMRIAMMLNEIEDYLVQIVRRGIPLMGVDTTRIDADMAEKLRDCKGSKDLLKMFLLTGAGSMTEIFSRLDPFEAPATVVHLRAMLKEELNAATGVMDMQRGQALGGERRTRFEVNALLDAQGLQARHFRERFCRFLERGVQIARTIGANFKTADMMLFLEDGVIPTAQFPIQPFLAMPIVVSADPSSLYYKSEDSLRQEALELFPVFMEAVNRGVNDPYKTFYQLYKKLGIRDPISAGMLDPQQYMEMQKQMAIERQLSLLATNGEEESNGKASSTRKASSGK